MKLVSVIIPTFRRLDSLPIALESVFSQILTNAEFEIVTVDNSPEGSALPYLNNAKLKSPVPMLVLHEPRPGVAHARNAALAGAKGELIAFLDDDTRCEPLWLQQLLDVRDKFDAAMVFSPSHAEAPEAPPEHRAFIEKLFTREGPGEDVLMNDVSGASSSLHVRSMVLDQEPPFPLHTNDTGGEDDLVFHRALARGGKAAWAHNAFVHEIIPPTRANLTYAYRRSFAFGQGAPYNAFFAAKRNVLEMLRHMLIGLGQTTIFGVLGGGAWLFGLPNRAEILNHAVRGAGKVFWFTPVHFYGAWLEKNTRDQAGPALATPAAANQNDALPGKRSADAR